MKKIVVTAILVVGVLYASDFDGRIKSANNKLYIKECASCHFGYQPQLLPAKSWRKLMSNLENHFGDDASLDKKDRELLTNYLVKNASDAVNSRYKYEKEHEEHSRYKSFTGDKTIIRITRMPYFLKEHREIPSRFVKQKEVGSLSNCAACHTTAKRGYYGERGVYIPNYGRWD